MKLLLVEHMSATGIILEQEGNVHKVHKYADGGKVISSEGTRAPRPAPKPPARPRGDTVQVPKAESAADALRNQRARQMKELGLRDGGPVKMPPKETRKIPPTQLPAPQSGTKPKRIGKR